MRANIRLARLYLWPAENYLHKLRLQRHKRNIVHNFLYDERKFRISMTKKCIHLAGLCFAIAVKIRKLEQPRKRLQPCSCTHMCKYTTKYAQPLLPLLSWHKTGTLAESFKHKPASCVNNIWLLLVAKCNWQLFTVCITTAVTDIPEPQC